VLGVFACVGCVDPYSLGPYSLAAAATSPTDLLGQVDTTGVDSSGLDNLNLDDLPGGLSFEDLQDLLNQQDSSTPTGGGFGGR